jgi:D-alanyl-D-alanine dipeptidase
MGDPAQSFHAAAQQANRERHRAAMAAGGLTVYSGE